MAFYKGTVQIAGGGQTDISDCAFKSKDNNFTAKNTFASLAAASDMPDGSALDGMSLVMTGTDGSRNVSFEQLKAAV